MDNRHGRFALGLWLWLLCSAVPAAAVGSPTATQLLTNAAALRDQGRVQESLPLLHQALDQAPDPAARALALGGLSDAWLLLRRLEPATRTADQALALARQSGDPAVLATALNHRGNLEMARDNPAAALAHYREAAALAGRAADPALEAALLINRVHAHLALGDPTAAGAALDLALERTRTLPPSQDRVGNLLALGNLALELPRTPQRLRQAHDVLSTALTLAATQDERTRSQAAGSLAEVYLATDQPEHARRLLAQALFHAATADAPELAARWHWRSGRLHRQRDPVAAGKAFRQAIDELRRIRPALVYGVRGQRRAFRDELGGVYLDLAELLLGQAAAEKGETRHRRLREARAVMEDFKTVELENYYQDACVAAHQARYPDLELERLISPGTAVLYPIVLPRRTALLLSLADGSLRQFDAGVDAEQLRQAAAAFRSRLQQSGNPRRLLVQAQELYDWLIRPLEASLAEHAVHTLVVAPDDLLRTIPFAALHDGQDYLLRRFALVVSPGLTLTTPSASRDRPELLLSGLSQSVQGYGELPYVGIEIQEISALYGGTRLLDETFIERTVHRELSGRAYSMVSFATHARFGGDLGQSFLLTYDERITLDELQDLISLGRLRDQPLELLVLSACETAEGDERAALGLAGVAIKAGARSVMASLWAVSDRSTAELVPAFFQRLRDADASKAQALQSAQLTLLDHPRFSHPFYWAPFILIGNWH